MKGNSTVKQRRFLKAYLDGKSLADCAKYAGSKGKTRETLAVVGHEILKKINPDLREIQDALGVTDVLLTKILREGLNAYKTELAIYKGKICDSVDMVDYSNRAKYLEIAHRLRGQFVDRHELTGKEGGDIELVIKPASRGEPKKIDVD